ncbi:MAG: hypothetical protein PHG85_03130 [Candidatus Altiarchaeota archaeon]|nr:hypothetical protein [Candidatus Altiarchaeota archaeon]
MDSSKLIFPVICVILASGCLCCNSNYVSNDEMLSYCNQITDLETKQTCIGMASEDSSPCVQLQTQASRDFCLRWTARASRDGKMCASISDENQRNQCYYAMATLTKDSNHCYEITNQESAQLCIAQTDKDPSICDSYGWSSPDIKLRCAGVTKEDSTYCDRITSDGWKNDCNYYIAIKTGATGPCTYYSKENIPWCYGIVGHSTSSADVCKGLSEDDSRYCRAMANGNPAECSQIANTQTRGYCYRNAIGIAKGAYDE